MKSRSWGISRDIGYRGEQFVASLLPGAIHINDSRDVHEVWDVEWRGMKLDIKTTLQTKSIPVFNGFNTDEDVIFVCTNLSDRNNVRFYVRHARQGWKSTFTHEIPDTAESLEGAITDCHNNYSLMYKKTVDKVHE